MAPNVLEFIDDTICKLEENINQKFQMINVTEAKISHAGLPEPHNVINPRTKGLKLIRQADNYLLRMSCYVVSWLFLSILVKF
jgi:hypothetical protein